LKKSKESSKVFINARDKYLQTKYGIGVLWYAHQLITQNHSCAICKKHQSNFKNSLHVDHNHKTGKVRGLLCYYCNRRLVGRNTIESATKILKYLLKYDEEAK